MSPSGRSHEEEEPGKGPTAMKSPNPPLPLWEVHTDNTLSVKKKKIKLNIGILFRDSQANT